MKNLTTLIFALLIISSAQATPVAPIPAPETSVIQVRAACGAGRTRINGVCVARTTKRQVRRCAVWGAGNVCTRWY